MRYEGMKPEEAIALTNFVAERLRFLNSKPSLFGKRKYEEKIDDFKSNFCSELIRGDNNFYGAVWQFFECNDAIFLGRHGMKELAEHTKKQGNLWVYINPKEGVRQVICEQ